MISEALNKAALDDLDDAYPDWREITGAPTGARPYVDTSVPFRKWLSTQDAAYQRRINHSCSVNIIRRAIERFQAGAHPPPQPQAS